MIRSYGLFWHIDRIYWGKQKDPGKLLGAASKSSKAKAVDFREISCIYALYADYDLVYVGQTGAKNDRLYKRLKQHTADHLSERWNRFSWFGTHFVTKKHELSTDKESVQCSFNIGLNHLEAVAIAICEPRLNLQRGKWGDKAKPYFQYYNTTNSK